MRSLPCLGLLTEAEGAGLRREDALYFALLHEVLLLLEVLEELGHFLEVVALASEFAAVVENLNILKFMIVLEQYK